MPNPKITVSGKEVLPLSIIPVPDAPTIPVTFTGESGATITMCISEVQARDVIRALQDELQKLAKPQDDTSEPQYRNLREGELPEIGDQLAVFTPPNTPADETTTALAIVGICLLIMAVIQTLCK